jgi:phosphate acetyltransferase/phosphate butyryltransferase
MTPADAFAADPPFGGIAIDDEIALERSLTAADLRLFAALAGEALHAAEIASASADNGVARTLWASTLVSHLLGSHFPGARLLTQSMSFQAPLQVGDTLAVRLRVKAQDAARGEYVLACSCRGAQGAIVADGELRIAAAASAAQARVRLPGADGAGLDLLQRARPLGAIRIAVVHPCDELSLAATLEARQAGLIDPILIAPRAKLEAVAHKAGLDIGGLAIDDVPHSHAAAARGAALAASGEVEALMKGSLHTDELMTAVVAREAGLRTARRISHAYLMQTPAYPRPFIITDAAINIAPTLEDKADIVRNAIDLAHVIGVALPRVAILAAVETVNVRMPATLDAAALCKMADRGQIEGGVLDGPLAFDNAISADAARTKGIVSSVAGAADVLVVPDLESGNLLAKQLEFLGGASSAGIVLGARVPIVLTSRADSRETRIASCALATLVAHRYRVVRP